MKLTEDIKIFDGVDNEEFEKEYKVKDIDEPVRKQILDDHEKARKLDEITINPQLLITDEKLKEITKWKVFYQQNQKLRELIEKLLEKSKTMTNQEWEYEFDLTKELQQLLEGSKK